MRLSDGTHYNPDGAAACARCGDFPVGGHPDMTRRIESSIRCPRGCFHTDTHLVAAASMTQWNDEQRRIRDQAAREVRSFS